MKTNFKVVFTFVLMPLFFRSQTTIEESNKKPDRVFTDARFDWGITAGATYGLLEIGNLGRLRNEVITGNSIRGYQIGMFVQPQSDIFYVKPALLYTGASGDISTATKTKFNIQKIELPILFGIRFYKQWCVEGGPVLSRILKITENYDRYGQTDLGRNGLGYHAGLAFDNDFFFVKAAIQGVTYEAAGLKQSLRERNQVVVSAGFKFNGAPEVHMGTKKFRKVYIPRGKRKIRINYF